MSEEKQETKKPGRPKREELPGLKKKGNVTMSKHKYKPCPLQLSNRVFGNWETQKE